MQQPAVAASNTNESRMDTESGWPAKAELGSMFESIVLADSLVMNMVDTIIAMIMMANNEFSFVMDEFASTDYPILARISLCTYLILVSILLINLLIAMLGKTYQDLSTQPNENLRQWARALLTVERICSRSKRLDMLNKYSHVIKIHGAPLQQAGTIAMVPTMGPTKKPTKSAATMIAPTLIGRGSSRVAPESDTSGISSTSATINTSASSFVQYRRCYSSTWTLNERDQQEISVAKRLKHEHQLSIARTLARNNNNNNNSSNAPIAANQL